MNSWSKPNTGWLPWLNNFIEDKNEFEIVIFTDIKLKFDGTTAKRYSRHSY